MSRCAVSQAETPSGTVAVSAPSARSRWHGLGLALLGGSLLLAGCERTDTVQRGYRGLALTQLYKPSRIAASAEINQIPEPEEAADPDSPLASEVFKNVQILKDVKATEFSRLMQALSTWVAPEEGCDFCHNPNKLESDEKYTKVVARRMLQMTRQINTEWKPHVANTGVTCWTCHRGQAVPSGDWFTAAAPKAAPASLGNHAGKNMPAANAGNSALPYDPMSVFLTGDDNDVRIQGMAPLASISANRHTVKQAEWTYSLMMYMSNSLGVNCTYCHNTRAMGRWEESTPQRATAWHGIRMVRSLNSNFLTPLTPLFPAHRLGPLGDGPKIGCATCHKGAFKPLYGVSPLKDYPILGPTIQAALPAAAAPAAQAASAGTAGTADKLALLTPALADYPPGPGRP